ncbi:DUF1800 domain-containing protein [Vibrio genomosp. F10 str. 9ZC157]|uniref:DUF1800 domain-containing protein n=1 Tax=Vibrio genomosp. F10 TaxID=723171 RepID=UPI0004752030|nr:DUF1800 domain-containing protein [Vibrio genomosp. F10]
MIRTQSIFGWLLTCSIFVSLSGIGTIRAEEPFLSDKQAYRTLEQTTFGPTQNDLSTIRWMNVEGWIEHQTSFPATSHHQLFRTPFPGQAQRNHKNAWYQIALYSDDQFRQRAAYALSQILVVSRAHKKLSSRSEALTIYYDILVNNAFGNYRELLEKTALHPVMGTYLSMNGSKKADLKLNSFPDENFAREVMQLFTIGLYELNQDGSMRQKDGAPIPTYTQSDIEEVARALTGWRHDDWAFTKPMISLSQYHDTGSKEVLGYHVPAGQTPYQDLSSVLDILFNHSNTAPFVSRLLIQRLVTSNPSPEYVERVADVFDDDGHGIRGNLKAIFRAIILDQDAQNGSGTKIKEPIIVATHFHRAFDAQLSSERISDANRIMVNVHQEPVGSPSVFNFYSPNYQPVGPLSDFNMVAPETEILTWASYVDLINYLSSYVGYRPSYDLSLPLSDLQEVAYDSNKLLNLIDARLFGGTMSEQLRTSIIDGLNLQPKDATATTRIYHAVTISLASDEFFIQD